MSSPVTFDLAQYDTIAGSNKGVAIQLEFQGKKLELVEASPDDPAATITTPITWTMAGPDSKDYSDYMDAEMERRNRAERNGGKDKTPFTEARTGMMDQIVACSRGWSVMPLDGVKLPFTLENARLVLQRFPWAVEFLTMKMGDRANFLPSRSSN